MKAMIFSAGLGARLQPVTDNKPKALVEIDGLTLLEIAIRRLINFGIEEIIINVHHFAEKITSFLKEKNYFNIRIEISAEQKLLDTGGGLKRAAWFFDDDLPFLVHNVDVLTDMDYQLLLDRINKENALAALAVRSRDTNRYFLFNRKMQLRGWQNTATGEKIISGEKAQILKQYSFMGIQVLSPDIFAKFCRETKFSLVQAYLRLADKNLLVCGVDCGQSRWLDVGKPQTLKEAENFLKVF